MRVSTLTLFALVASVATASGAEKPTAVKDWVFTDTGGGSGVAYTNNDSGSRLGIFCYSAKSCDAYFYTSTACEDGSNYPVLVNSDTGSLSFTITCKNIAGAAQKPNFVFAFNEFDAVLNLMLKGHALGLAIPLASGQFRVVRFSLEGSNEALAAVSRVLKPSTTSPVSTKQNKDQTL